jgi:hypothetical protein
MSLWEALEVFGLAAFVVCWARGALAFWRDARAAIDRFVGVLRNGGQN